MFGFVGCSTPRTLLEVRVTSGKCQANPVVEKSKLILKIEAGIALFLESTCHLRALFKWSCSLELRIACGRNTEIGIPRVECIVGKMQFVQLSPVSHVVFSSNV